MAMHDAAALSGISTLRRAGCGLLHALILCAAWALPAAQAAISLSQSRLIVWAAEPEAAPQVTNEGDQPVLLQIWLDVGESGADPQGIAVPFVVTPPVLRLEPGNARYLRLLYTGQGGVPQDRESVYWLNILEIPPKVRPGTAQNHVQMAFRTRVKVFFRPAGIQMPESPPHEKLRFELQRHGDGGVLSVTNPTPVHQTLLHVAIGNGRRQALATVEQVQDMIAPGERRKLLVKFDGARPVSDAWVFFSVLNDFGAVVDNERRIDDASPLPARVGTAVSGGTAPNDR